MNKKYIPVQKYSIVNFMHHTYFKSIMFYNDALLIYEICTT